MVDFENRDEPGMMPQPASDQQPTKEVDVAFPKRSTSPAFQWYPKEFLSSSKVIAMSSAERGAYITLLSMQWLDGSIPNDLPLLARLTGIPTKQFISLWPRNLGRCFILKGGRLVNDRLERERKVQADYREKQKANADKRWEKHGNATAFNRNATAMPEARHELGNAPQSASAIRNPQSVEQKEDSAEPSNGSSPPVLTFPTVGPSTIWGLSSAQLAEWQGLFPNLDVWAEMRKAVAWLPANPSKRKTAKGMPRFLVAWLTRAVDHGNGNGHSAVRVATRTSAAPEPTFEPWTCPHVEDHANRWRCEQATQLGRPLKAEAS